MSIIFKIKKPCLYFALMVVFLVISGFGFQNNILLETATVFSYPLGFLDGQTYASRINFDYGTLIEKTYYSVQNPDLSGVSNCYDTKWIPT